MIPPLYVSKWYDGWQFGPAFKRNGIVGPMVEIRKRTPAVKHSIGFLCVCSRC